MANQVTVEQGAQNFIDRAGSPSGALARAQKNLRAYTDGFMSNASDAAESIEWYLKVVRKLKKMARNA